METFLAQLKGHGHIPFNYIIRHLVVPLPGTVFPTDEEQAIAIAPLNGPDFEQDNSYVYGVLKQLCLEGPGRAYILRFDPSMNG